MKSIVRSVGLALILSSLTSFALSAPDNTPATRKVEQARKQIAAKPNDAQGFSDLALALARRARETADPAYYAEAQKAIDQAVTLAPESPEHEKAQIWVLLGQHEFSRALERARALNKRIPDDVLVYGFIVDAAVETGQYEEAERAAQWMLDLRPGNIPGLTRAAYLRELFGDLDGAVELMLSALQRIAPQETEDRAWTLTQIAHLRLAAGKPGDAEEAARQALLLFPGYHYALGQMARIKLAQNLAAEAVDFERQRYQAAPHPENLYALAQALRRAGRSREARAAFTEFEQKALAESAGADNANHELTFYYTEVAKKPAQALAIAAREIARRRDVHTLDAYGWALFANGKTSEARQHLEAALAVGIRDAGMLYRAGAIAMKQKDRKSAARYLQQSLALAPGEEFAPAARRMLAQAGAGNRQLAMVR